MSVAFPTFQYRFMAAMGHVIFPANFHPVGTQHAAQQMLDRVAANPASGPAPTPGAGGNWLVVGGSGGFGSAARAVLGARRGAHTLNLSLDALPNLESNNKVRQVGSPGFHRNLALERGLRARGLLARTIQGDAFAPEIREAAINEIRESFGGPNGGKLDGIVWSLAAPRALDPRTGKSVSSALKSLGQPVTIKTFTGRDERKGEPARVVEMSIDPGTPEEAIGTIYVMGGGIVDRWISTLLAADVLAEGFTLLTISYRGNPLNEGVYRKGLIGLAKADLEYTTRALDALLQARVGGRAIAVEGPAVVTEASGGIPGVPLYLATVMDVMGERFEDPTASMMRMFDEHFGPAGPTLDDEGLLRMDDRELEGEVQAQMQARFAAANVGDAFPDALYDAFMTAYAQTRGFAVPGIDYAAEFEPAEVCDPA